MPWRWFWSCCLLGWTVLVHAAVGEDPSTRLVFGSFAAEANAHNWAKKLTLSFAQHIDVEVVVTASGRRYRVLSQTLSQSDLIQLGRKAQANGVEYWRLSSVATSDVQQPPTERAGQFIRAKPEPLDAH